MHLQFVLKWLYRNFQNLNLGDSIEWISMYNPMEQI